MTCVSIRSDSRVPFDLLGRGRSPASSARTVWNSATQRRVSFGVLQKRSLEPSHYRSCRKGLRRSRGWRFSRMASRMPPINEQRRMTALNQSSGPIWLVASHQILYRLEYATRSGLFPRSPLPTFTPCTARFSYTPVPSLRQRPLPGSATQIRSWFVLPADPPPKIMISFSSRELP